MWLWWEADGAFEGVSEDMLVSVLELRFFIYVDEIYLASLSHQQNVPSEPTAIQHKSEWIGREQKMNESEWSEKKEWEAANERRTVTTTHVCIYTLHSHTHPHTHTHLLCKKYCNDENQSNSRNKYCFHPDDTWIRSFLGWFLVHWPQDVVLVFCFAYRWNILPRLVLRCNP